MPAHPSRKDKDAARVGHPIGGKSQRGLMGHGGSGSGRCPRVALRSTRGYVYIFPPGRLRLIFQNGFRRPSGKTAVDAVHWKQTDIA
jgi:hypothetical protein